MRKCLGFRSGDWSLDADYSLVDATFRSRIALPSTSPFADPDTGVGFAYVMNQMNVYPFSDPRELALRQALFRDVLRVREQH